MTPQQLQHNTATTPQLTQLTNAFTLRSDLRKCLSLLRIWKQPLQKRRDLQKRSEWIFLYLSLRQNIYEPQPPFSVQRFCVKCLMLTHFQTISYRNHIKHSLSPTGTHCEIPVNFCDNHKCQHGGSCVIDYTRSLGYKCLCRKSFMGTYCQKDPSAVIKCPEM